MPSRYREGEITLAETLNVPKDEQNNNHDHLIALFVVAATVEQKGYIFRWIQDGQSVHAIKFRHPLGLNDRYLDNMQFLIQGLSNLQRMMLLKMVSPRHGSASRYEADDGPMAQGLYGTQPKYYRPDQVQGLLECQACHDANGMHGPFPSCEVVDVWGRCHNCAWMGTACNWGELDIWFRDNGKSIGNEVESFEGC